MAKKLDEFIGSLPKEKQIATEQGFQKLDAEYIAFQELRKAMHFTQWIKEIYQNWRNALT